MRIADLVPGARLRIKKTFRDHSGVEVAAGTVLVLVKHDVFAHDDGHTLTFEQNLTLRLSGDDPRTAPVLYDAADEFWELVR